MFRVWQPVPLLHQQQLLLLQPHVGHLLLQFLHAHLIFAFALLQQLAQIAAKEEESWLNLCNG